MKSRYASRVGSRGGRSREEYGDLQGSFDSAVACAPAALRMTDYFFVGFCAAATSGRNAPTEIPRVPPEKPSMYAEFTPITWPRELNTGPPLPPCAVGAS